MVLGRKTNFFLGKRWFGRERPTFIPRKKMVLGRKLFPWENQKNKNTIFWETMRPKSTKMVTPKPSLA